MENLKYNDKYKIRTPSGWSDFVGVKQTTTDILFTIEFTDNSYLKCTENHQLKYPNGLFLEASQCLIGDQLFGGKVISNISYEIGEFEVYDAIGVESNAEYFTNDCVSANCAHMPDSEEIWTSAQLTLATGGDAILLSTPFGSQGLFHKLWQQAEEGSLNNEMTGRFNPIKLPWYLHPERDQAWRDSQDVQLGKRMSAQECDCLDRESIVTIKDKIINKISRVSLGELYDIIEDSSYQILTPTGFQNIHGMRKVVHDEYFDIELSSGKNIKCSITHPFISKGSIRTAHELFVGDTIDSLEGYVSITSKNIIKESIDLFDIVEVDNGNIFIANDIITHNCNFDFSGHTVIEAELLQHYANSKDIQEPLERRGIGGDLWIFKYPNSMKTYLVSSDISRGDGEDYSAFHVIDVETVEQVAEFKGKIDTQSMGRMLIAIATEYNNALLVIDNKNIGWSTIQVVIDSGYKNLYYSYKNDPFLDENIHLRKKYDMVNKEDMVPGLTTTTRLRPVLISKLEMYFRDKTPIIHSKRLINELQVFMWIGGKAQAQGSYNDDLVMALAMALYIRDTSLKLRQIGIELVKSGIANVHKTVYKPINPGNAQWEMNIGRNGSKESIKWLL